MNLKAFEKNLNKYYPLPGGSAMDIEEPPAIFRMGLESDTWALSRHRSAGVSDQEAVFIMDRYNNARGHGAGATVICNSKVLDVTPPWRSCPVTSLQKWPVRPFLTLPGVRVFFIDTIRDNARGASPGKKLLVSMALEGKFVDSELQSLDEGDDVLTSLARELVMNRGVGESADAIWRELRAQSATVHAASEVPALTEPAPPRPATASSKSDLMFAQTITDPVRKRTPVSAEQLSLF